jgi:hypothetical protein
MLYKAPAEVCMFLKLSLLSRMFATLFANGVAEEFTNQIAVVQCLLMPILVTF